MHETESGQRTTSTHAKHTTHTMEVQRVRPTWRVRARDRERELDCRILGEHVHAAVWKELRRGARPTQDLQQHGHRRRRERRAVGVEYRAILQTQGEQLALAG